MEHLFGIKKTDGNRYEVVPVDGNGNPIPELRLRDLEAHEALLVVVAERDRLARRLVELTSTDALNASLPAYTS